MEKSLKNFTIGECGRVKTVIASGALRRRLFDMGLTPKAQVTMRKSAPLGDPIEITLRGYTLSLRKAEADVVIMETT